MGMNMPMRMDIDIDIDISQFAQCGGAVVFLVVLSFDLSIIPVFFLTDVPVNLVFAQQKTRLPRALAF
jgi:hypothetical protein